MRAARVFLLSFVALGLLASPTQANGLSNKDIETVMMQFITDLSQSLTAAAPAKRRLLTWGGEGLAFPDFMSNLFGSNWGNFVPESWSLPSFDWSYLGEFEYSNNLGDFLMNNDLRNITQISSPKDLQDSLATVEAAFCTPEAFTPSMKKPASCTGPSVSIALVPKVCALQGAIKQVVCDPAKLVLTKTAGSCTHKYLGASEWKGKECKISGRAGLADNKTVGGDIILVPLPLYQTHALAPAPPTAP